MKNNDRLIHKRTVIYNSYWKEYSLNIDKKQLILEKWKEIEKKFYFLHFTNWRVTKKCDFNLNLWSENSWAKSIFTRNKL